MAQLAPMGHVVLVHRGAPPEDIVANEEARHDGHGDGDERDREEGGDFAVELFRGDDL
jgi:hypothetical protein